MPKITFVSSSDGQIIDNSLFYTGWLKKVSGYRLSERNALTLAALVPEFEAIPYTEKVYEMEVDEVRTVRGLVRYNAYEWAEYQVYLKEGNWYIYQYTRLSRSDAAGVLDGSLIVVSLSQENSGTMIVPLADAEAKVADGKWASNFSADRQTGTPANYRRDAAAKMAAVAERAAAAATPHEVVVAAIDAQMLLGYLDVDEHRILMAEWGIQQDKRGTHPQELVRCAVAAAAAAQDLNRLLHRIAAMMQ